MISGLLGSTISAMQAYPKPRGCCYKLKYAVPNNKYVIQQLTLHTAHQKIS